MALVVRGRTLCFLCGAPLEEGQEIRMFPPGLFSPESTLSRFNDSAVHESCFREHPGYERAAEAWSTYLQNFQS